MCEIKTGIELELWVVDEAGRLSDGSAISDAHERIEPEFIDPLVEVKTAPHDDEFGLRRDLETTLRAGMDAAARDDKHLVPLGTPLTKADAPANCERGQLFETIYGDGVRSAKNCAGTHIHFQKERVTAQLNALTAIDPALCLVSSSPYYCGTAAGYSSRALAYRTKCGEAFREFCDLWPYADSVREWRARVDRAFERFTQLASSRGVSADRLTDHFQPENTVLNPVRLRECQPTVEWRAPDAALPSEVVRLAVDVGEVVAQTRTKSLDHGPRGVAADRIGVPEVSELRELTGQSIRRGVDSTAVETYLREMGFDPSAYQPFAPAISGPRVLGDAAARRLRLEQAGRLRRDLETVAV